MRRSSARRITAVILFRLCPAGLSNRAADADFRETGGQSLTTAGADRVLTMDLHGGQPRLFRHSDGHLCCTSLSAYGRSLHRRGRDRYCLPGCRRRRPCPRDRAPHRRGLAIIKRRERAGVSEVMNIIGDVDGQRCILVDDIVDRRERSAMRQSRSKKRREFGWRLCNPRSPVRRCRGAGLLTHRNDGHHGQYPRNRSCVGSRKTSAKSPSPA